MIVYFKKNKQPACYDSENLMTVGRLEPPEHLRGPFESCGDCPYASHGFVCYTAEGDCLKTHLNKFQKTRKAENL